MSKSWNKNRIIYYLNLIFLICLFLYTKLLQKTNKFYQWKRILLNHAHLRHTCLLTAEVK